MSYHSGSGGRSLASNDAKLNHPDVGSLLLHDLPSSSTSSASSTTTAATTKRVGNTTNSEKTQQQMQGGFKDKTDLLSKKLNLTPTSTSATLILIIHLLWLYQWNGRRRPSKVNYKTIVHKREYHQLWVALLSHPPTSKDHRQRNHRLSPTAAGSAAAAAAAAATTTTTASAAGAGGGRDGSRPQDIRRQIIAQARQCASWAYQSGFALLLYNSHIIWSCRSLEALYIICQGRDMESSPTTTSTTTIVAAANDDTAASAAAAAATTIDIQPHQYVRVLFALAAISLLLELRFSFHLLRISRKLEGSDSTTTISSPPSSSSNNRRHHRHRHARSRNNHQMQQKILQRPVGTLTALACALVVVFQHHFEYVPLQVIPFVDNKLLLLGFSMPAGLTSLLCWGILGYLSYPSYPITPILCGLVSGSLWAIGLTSFLQERYWGNSIIAAFFFVCCLSLRASGGAKATNVDVTTGGTGTGAAAAAGAGTTTTTTTTPTTTIQSIPTYIPCVDFVSPSYSGRRDPEEEGDHHWTTATTTFAQNNNNNRSNLNSISEDGEESTDDDDEDSDASSHTSSSQDTALHLEDHHRDENNDDASSVDLEMAPLLLDVERRQTVRARRGASNS